MTKAALLLTTLLLLPISAFAGPKSGKFAQGQAEFARGNFAGALKLLDAAAAEGNDDSTTAKIHLLRGQCFAAQQQFDDAEVAFSKALAHDPESSLDPSRVDPKLVRMLDDLRERTRTDVNVRASVPGAAVKIDGQYVGTSPVSAELSVGRHKFEALSPDGKRSGRTEVVIRPNRVVEVAIALEDNREPPKEPPPPQAMMHAFADLRLVWNPALPLPGSGGLEAGGGVEHDFWRAGLHFRLFPSFGVTPRGALHIPIISKWDGVLEAELPFIFTRNGLEVGFGAAAGAEWMLNKWIGFFGQVGFRYNFIVVFSEQSQLYLEGGVRFRLPR